MDGNAAAGAIESAPVATISSAPWGATDAARGPGAARPSHVARRIVYSLAAQADEADLRRLLRENPMQGRVALSMEREPDYFLAADVEGDVHHTILGRDVKSGRAVVMGSISVRDGFINGQPARVGYLGQLRLDQAYRGTRHTIVDGYQFFRRLHDGLGVSMYLTSIVADNHAARRFLGASLPGIPTYRELEPFITFVAPASRRIRRRAKGNIRIANGSITHLSAIVDCLERNSRRFQFAPRWSAEDLVSPILSRGLILADFRLAFRGSKLIGCAALWDQRHFKQIVVRGYERSLAAARPLLNLVGPMLGLPRLPSRGQAIRQVYVSHLAIDEDDPAVFGALVESLRDHAAKMCESPLIVLGLSARHPLLPCARRALAGRTYESMLYTVHWDDGPNAYRSLDARPTGPEVALL